MKFLLKYPSRSRPDLCGVYKIVNTKTGKFYVGSSYDCRRRFRDHMRILRAGKHRNPHLQFAFNKDGRDAFALELIVECNRESVRNTEQHYLDTSGCLARGVGYNIRPLADGGTSEETRERLRISHLGNRHSDEAKRKIGAASKGNKYRLGTTISQAHKQTIHKWMLAHAPMRGRRGPLNPNYGKKRPADSIARMLANRDHAAIGIKNFKPVRQLTRDGQILAEYKSIKAAAFATGAPKNRIGAVCKGLYKSTGGYKWEWIV